jgi:hypothetical protein
MKQEITLEQYLKLGGKLERINWRDAFCDYGDHNQGAKVVSYEDKGEKGGHNAPLFHFTFDNGRSHRYAIGSIKIKVDFVLAETYR